MDIRSLPLLSSASAAFVSFTGLMIWGIAGLVRSNRRQFVAIGPLVEEQEFELPGSLPLLLMLEVPRFGSNFRDLRFEIVERTTGKVTMVTYDRLRAQGAVYGVSTMRVPIGRITPERSGGYLIRVLGLGREATDPRSRILFSRPYLGRMAVQIIAIVLCGVGVLLSLLLVLWQLIPLRR